MLGVTELLHVQIRKLSLRENENGVDGTLLMTGNFSWMVTLALIHRQENEKVYKRLPWKTGCTIILTSIMAAFSL